MGADEEGKRPVTRSLRQTRNSLAAGLSSFLRQGLHCET